MTVSNRLSRNLEVSIKDKKIYSLKPRQEFAGGRGGESLSSKIKMRCMPVRLSEYIPEPAVLKELSYIFHKMKVCGGVCILKMVRMYYSFTGALKCPALFFQKYFQTKLR